MVDKCRSDCGNIQSVLDVNREILMKTSDIKNLGNAYRSIYEAKTKEEEVSDNKEFVPHMMYDPETGKGHKAEKPEDHERMKKMGYTHEEPDLVKEKKLPRQMLDPKKDVMVVKNNKVIVIDKSKEKEYLKKGWGLAEQSDKIDEKMKFGKRLKVGDIVYVDDGGKGVEGKIHKIIGKHDRDSGTFEVKLKSGKVVKKNLDQMSADDDIMEAVSPAQQAAIAISKKEKEEMKKESNFERNPHAKVKKIKRPKQGDYKNYIDLRPSKLNAPGGRDKVKYTYEGNVKDLAMKIDKIVAKMNKDSKLKSHAKKFASMAMDTMDIEKSLEKSLPSSVSGAVMIGLLEGVVTEALDPVDNKAVDKKFKDRKDKDIDNDGDVDDSDEYLHNRRAKVDDAIDAKKKEKKENAKPKKKKLKASADANFEPMSDVAKSPKTAEIEKIGEEFIAMLEAALKSDGKDKDGKKLSKDALEDEEYHEKEPKKGKDFIAKHKKSDKSLEDKESEASATETNDDPMGKTKKDDIGTKPKSGKRPQDDNSGDTNIIKSTEAPIKEGSYENPLAGKGYPAQENKEEPIPSIAVMAQKQLSGEGDKMDLVQMAVKHMNGEKVDFTKKAEKTKNPYDGRMKLAREFMKRMDKRRGIEASVKTPKVETAVAPQETLNKNGEK